MTQLTSSTEAAARSAMYGLLARFWLREADLEFLSQLGASPLRDAFVEAGGVLPSGNGDAAIEQLAIDYCRLFVGPTDHLPPHQSVWQGGQFYGTSIESMRQYMDLVRYDADRLPPGMMLDHLGVQLDVMGHTLGQTSTWPSGVDSQNAAAELAHLFFVKHLQWPTDLLEIAANRASTDFYRSAILLTGCFLRSETMV